MRGIRLFAFAMLCAGMAAPASADVTLRIKRTESVFGGRVIDTTEYRKGLRVRTDSSGGGIASVSAIMDAGTGRYVMLWHDGKSGDVVDINQQPAALRDAGVPEVKQSITPTGESRQIAGWTCTVYQFKSSVRYPQMEKDGAVIYAVEGSMCLVKNGPGQADFSALQRAQRAFGPDPLQVGNSQITELGVPFATSLTIRLGGDQMTKEIGSYTTEVLSVSTAPIPDAIFEIPADYKVIKR